MDMNSNIPLPAALITEGKVDELVLHACFPPDFRGVMVEVGAASPDFLSLGHLFRRAGWRVISIEPNPIFAAQHRARGHEILEFACGEADADAVPFTLVQATDIDYLGGAITYESFSSLGIRDDYRHLFERLTGHFTTREISVRMRRLDTLFANILDLHTIDVLTLDTEGWELECLRGLDLNRYQPRVLVVEDLFGTTALDQFLHAYGYRRWHRVTPNNIYLAPGQEVGDTFSGLRQPMTSYTPNLEDVLLRRCFPYVTDGFYVDIGAHHPTHASVTRWFYDQGWSGINVEPGEGILALREERARDINVEMAVADREGEATFYVHSGNTGTSTLLGTVPEVVSERAGEIQEVKVRLTTLPALLDTYAPGRHIQFLKIDAEGAEDAIIRAADWVRHRPEVLVIESSLPYTNQRVTAVWQDILAANRYLFAYFDGVNDFWVREESAYLIKAFAAPVNVLDNYRIYDPEVVSLRGQVTALTAALDATKRYADVCTTELEQRRQQVTTLTAALDATKLHLDGELRILFCTIVPLDSSSGGTMVCQEHVRRLGALPGVRLYVMAPDGSSADFVASVGAEFEQIPLTRAIRGWGVAHGFTPTAWLGLGGNPQWAFPFELMAFQQFKIDWLFCDAVRRFRPDVIVLDYLYTALFVPSAFHAQVPVVVINLNREQEFFRHQRQLGRLPQNAADSWLAEWRLGCFEREVLANADRWVVLSEHDIPKQAPLAERTTVIKPVLGARPERWRYQGNRNLFFVGNINHYPNFTAVRWLCTALAPALEQIATDVRITIIGASGEEVPSDWQRPNVDFLGQSSQAEVQRQFTTCGLFIAPIENNFGSKIKVLEALAHGTPLVANIEALSGLIRTDGIPLFALSDPEGAARLIVDLLDAPAQLNALSQRVEEIRMAQMESGLRTWFSLLSALRAKPVLHRQPFPNAFLRQRQKLRWQSGFDLAQRDDAWLRSAGFEPLEIKDSRPLRWTQPQAYFTVLFEPQYFPRWLHLKLRAITPAGGQNFRMWVNEVEILADRVFGQDYEAHVKLPRFEGTDEFTLRLECLGFQAPEDKRTLGLAIEFIRLVRQPQRLQWQSGFDLAQRDDVWLRSAGFDPVEIIDDRPLRWTQPQAYLMVLFAPGDFPRWLHLKLRAITPASGQNFRMLVNEVEILADRVFGRDYEAHVKLPRFEGTDEFTLRLECLGFQMPGDDKTLGLAIEFIRLLRQPQRLRWQSGFDLAQRDDVWLRSAGFDPIEIIDDRPLRWTQPQAYLMVLFEPGDFPRWLHLKLRAITPAGGQNFRMLVNEVEILADRVFGRDYEAHVKLPRFKGTDEFTLRLECLGFQMPGDDKTLGLAIEFIRLLRQPQRLRWQSGFDLAQRDDVWLRSAGFAPIEIIDNRPLRWTETQAYLTVLFKPGDFPRWLHLKLRAITPADGHCFRMLVNEVEILADRVFGQDYEAHVKLPRFQGTDEFTLRFECPGFQAPGDTRTLGLAIEFIRLFRRKPPK